MKRITKNTVTDALLEAMEHADQMESIAILYHNKPSDSKAFGMITDDGCTVERMNFLVDVFKAWMIKCCIGTESDEE